MTVPPCKKRSCLLRLTSRYLYRVVSPSRPWGDGAKGAKAQATIGDDETLLDDVT